MTTFQLGTRSSMWKGPLRPSRTATGYKLTPTDGDVHDDLFCGDGNLLISHEPGSYTMSNQFS
jgi:hypothetical protein